MKAFFLFKMMCALLMVAVACGDDDNNSDIPEKFDIDGMITVRSDDSVDSTIQKLQAALQTNNNIGIVATIDHAANAQNAGLSLRPTQIILFGNPNLGTPFMQENQTAGIDLPQKMLVYENADEEVIVAYNHPQYVADRHGITGNDEQIKTISGALANFAENAAGNSINPNAQSNDTGDEGEGLITVQSENSVDTTYQNFVDAIEGNEALSVMAQLDHQANAESVGMELRPTRLLVFGNPNLGTPLMQGGQTVAIDLPQKILVYEDAEGQVFIVYNDPNYLAERHDINGQQEILDKIAGALRNLAKGAAE